jgi:ribose transport system permease protein
LFALGANAQAARYSGIAVSRLRVASYVLCSVITALAALLEAGSIGSVTPSTAGSTYEMYAITAAVLGGCSLRGGKGSLFGVIVGAAMLRMLRSSVIFLDISTYWTLAVTGLVLLGAVVTDALVRRRRPS